MILKFDIAMASATLIPSLVYCFIIYLSSPFKSLSLKYSFAFMIAGIFSVVILDLLNVLFPYWNVYYMCTPFDQQFLTVAPKEELVKYIMFWIVYRNLKNEYDLHPITYMFYFGMVGLGFAFIENVGYSNRFGIQVMEYRALGATAVHMICGLLFGYWLGMSKIKRSNYFFRSVANIYLNKKPKFKYFIYWIAGLITACMFHGMWNFNYLTAGPVASIIAILLIFIGLIITKLLTRDLLTQYRQTLDHDRRKIK
jgi:RsiW-degrading membrane proteinase PrsW (M82 family)